MSASLKLPPVGGTPTTHGAVASAHGGRYRLLGAILAGVLVVALVVGIVPRITRQQRLAAAVTATAAAPAVSVTTVEPATGASTVTLPGALAALQTAPIYARAPGYVRRSLVDIGSRVRGGDLLAEINAPELDHQVQQARGAVAQARASLALAEAQLTRWRAMSTDSVVTADELDQKRAAYGVTTASLASAEANLRQLMQLQQYERVLAPFTGVITTRNVDPGALVGTTGGVTGSLPSGAGSPPGSLFQLARSDTLSVYVSVPEDYAPATQVGKPAVVTVTELPGDTLRGIVARTARALDPAARTLLTEVDVANPTGRFLPGMYAQVQLPLARSTAVLRLPATALVIRNGPPKVVTVSDSVVRYATVTVGRDYGSWVEVTGGLASGAVVVLNPTDDLQDGQHVRPVPTKASLGG
jgi:RND family efflux transporter MFP subunit